MMKKYFKLILSIIIAIGLWVIFVNKNYKYSVGDCLARIDNFEKERVFLIDNIRKNKEEYFMWEIDSNNLYKPIILKKEIVETYFKKIVCPERVK